MAMVEAAAVDVPQIGLGEGGKALEITTSNFGLDWEFKRGDAVVRAKLEQVRPVFLGIEAVGAVSSIQAGEGVLRVYEERSEGCATTDGVTVDLAGMSPPRLGAKQAEWLRRVLAAYEMEGKRRRWLVRWSSV